ncbi:MAG: MarR family winged helix-turn-helix transcriptional regulator, partial [Alphaproteobacteria bacterium]
MSAADGTEQDLILDEFLPYLFNRITNRLNQDLLLDLRPLRVSVPRWRVLAVLRAREGRRMGDLSAYTVIEQSSLSRVIDQMERDNLVVRRHHVDDNRIIEVYLTDEGRAMFDQIYPLAFAHYQRAIS